MKTKLSKKQIRYILKEYNSGKAVNSFIHLLPCSRSTVTRLLQQHGITIRSRGSYMTVERASSMSKRHSCNKEFFSQQTPTSIYWAGFIAADGNINERDESMKIAIQANDKAHLIQFSKDIQYTGNVRDYPQKDYTGKIIYSSRVELYEKQIVEDLATLYNITPRKSLTLLPPNLTDISQILPYIIGLVDGDGCIYSRDNNKYLTVNLLGTKMLLDWIKESLESIEIFSGSVNVAKNTTYQLSINQRLSLKKLSVLVQTLNLPILKRKWSKLYEHPYYQEN